MGHRCGCPARLSSIDVPALLLRSGPTPDSGSSGSPKDAKLTLVGTALTGEIPLICREAELDPILAALEGTVPAAFVLAGPAGVGKTRLASEVVKLAEARGFAVAHASGSRGTAPIPFGPFAPFLPESSQQSAGLLGLLRQANDAIARRAGPNGKLLLIVDNAQHLDEGSAALVHQLVEQRTCGVLVVVERQARS